MGIRPKIRRPRTARSLRRPPSDAGDDRFSIEERDEGAALDLGGRINARPIPSIETREISTTTPMPSTAPTSKIPEHQRAFQNYEGPPVNPVVTAARSPAAQIGRRARQRNQQERRMVLQQLVQRGMPERIARRFVPSILQMKRGIENKNRMGYQTGLRSLRLTLQKIQRGG